MPARAPRITPRGLRLPDAAAYVGVSEREFLYAVQEKDMPAGVLWRGCRIWDIHQLDLAMDRIFGQPPQTVGADDDWSGAAA